MSLPSGGWWPVVWLGLFWLTVGGATYLAWPKTERKRRRKEE